MREQCKHFQSRTYRSGEVVRFCSLDLAPEAPWRCPDDCDAYAPRLADVGWARGTLVSPPTPREPKGLDTHDEAAELLDAAEDIVNAVGPEVVADAIARRRRAQQPWWRRLFPQGRRT
jgi:hypothetical protein